MDYLIPILIVGALFVVMRGFGGRGMGGCCGGHGHHHGHGGHDEPAQHNVQTTEPPK